MPSYFIHTELVKGNLAIKKPKYAFLAIAVDQAYEQNIASVKDNHSAVGLTENPQ